MSCRSVIHDFWVNYSLSCSVKSAHTIYKFVLYICVFYLNFPLSRFRANIVVQCENWWNLAKQFASRSPPLHMLSSTVQRTLMKALVLGGFAHMDSDTKQQYWAEVRKK